MASRSAPSAFTVNLSSVSFTGEGLVRPESVLCTASGTLFVSDKRGGVMRIGADGVQTFIGKSAIIPNGIALQRDRSLLVANLSDDGGVWRIAENGSVTPFLTELDGKRLGSVNFVMVDRRERVWICVSTVRAGDHQFRKDIADGFIVLHDERGTRVVADGVHWTNECRIDAQEEYLYVCETFGRRLSRFRLSESGELGARETVAEFGVGTFPDGLAVDAEGGLWVVSVVSNRIIRVLPDGRQHVVMEDYDQHHLDQVENAFQANQLGRPMLYDNHSKVLPNVTSLAFGGPDLKTAYMGSINGDRIAVFRSPVAGLPPAHWDWA